MLEIARQRHCGSQQRREIARLRATEQRRYEARELGCVHEPVQRRDHGIEAERNLAQRTGARIGDANAARRAERGLDLFQGRVQIGIRAFAIRVFGACGQNVSERCLARGPDVERGPHRRRRDAVEHHAANARRVAAREFLRDASAIGTAPKIDALVAQRRANRVDIGDDFRGDVARHVDIVRGAQFAQLGQTALRGGRSQIDVDQLIEEVARRQGSALQRRRFTGAAGIDQDDVAGASDSGQRDRNRNRRLGRLTGSSGKHEQGVRIGTERVGGQDRNEQRQRAAVRLRPVLGHIDGGALRRRRELG